VVLNNPLFVARNSRSGYQIGQSLRLNSADSYTFRRTPSSNSTSQKKFTVSAWVKRGLLASGTGNASGRQTIFYTGVSNGSGNMFGLEWNDDGLACIFNGAGTIWPETVAKFRDPSAWYHVVAAVDTAQATTADRFKLYVNGVEQTVTGTLPTQDFLVTNGTTSVHAVGELSTYRANMYVAELYYINDQQLTPGDFGEPNNEGVWIPKKYAGTFTGTNSCYLKFDPSATNGIGHDHSGNGNNFTPSASFNTSGTGTDVFSDTPTTNWCTLNPLNTDNISTFSEGNLSTVCSTGAGQGCSSGGSIAVSSGKWYCEMVCTAKTATNALIGICTIDGFDGQRQIDESQNGGSGYGYVTNGTRVPGGTSYGTTWAVDDIMGIAMDLDSAQNTLTFYKNGVSQGAINITNARYVFGCSNGQGSSSVTYSVNFGQRAFAYTPPSGFSALNTRTLPAPDIADGSQYFDTVLWTGDTTTKQLPLNFTADFVWAKRRQSDSHVLYDVIRGENNQLTSNSTSGESTNDYGLDFLGHDYLEIEGSKYFGGGGGGTPTFVAWNWLAANGTSSIAAGSIDGTEPRLASTVSVNPSAGFSIVTWTAPGSSQTNSVGHGLGVAPSFVICKSYSGGAGGLNWSSYHVSLGKDKFINLESNGAAQTVSNYWGANGVTSTIIGLPTGSSSTGYNNNTGNMIAYCFAEVPGFSRIGSYTGTNTSDNTFVYCGFAPAWILVKSYGTGGTNWDWRIYDNKRNTYNPVDNHLEANQSLAEDGDSRINPIDFLSNGFKIRASYAEVGSNTTYIFAAFAEHPLGGRGVSPATAR